MWDLETGNTGVEVEKLEGKVLVVWTLWLGSWKERMWYCLETENTSVVVWKLDGKMLLLCSELETGRKEDMGAWKLELQML